MKLTATVVGIESGQAYSDGKRRIKLKIKEAEAYNHSFVIAENDGDRAHQFQLDETFTMELGAAI